MNNKDPHQDLELMILVAKNQAKEHNCNYNIIIHNPDENGNFVKGESTYEMVADSYFEKPRPNAKLLHKTDNLHDQEKTIEDYRDGDEYRIANDPNFYN